jgi:hypothetical protein
MRPSLLLALAAACTDRGDVYRDALWSPDEVTVVGDRLLVPLAGAAGLLALSPDGTVESFDLAPERVDHIEAAPDGETALLRTTSTSCDEAVEPRAARYRFVDQCPEEARVERHSFLVFAGDEIVGQLDLPPWFSRLTFSPDGRFAVSLINPAEIPAGAGLVNLNAMRVIDLAALSVFEVTVGFGATKVTVLQTDGQTTSALVLAQGEADLIDLSSGLPDPDAVFPLSLDADAPVTAQSVSTSADGRYALLSTSGSADLYILDLPGRSINIVGLPGVPVALVPDPDRDRTLIAYHSRNQIDLLDHDRFELTTVPLEEPLTHLERRGDLAIGWSIAGYRDAIRLDLTTDQLDEYRLNYPSKALYLDSSGAIGVSLSSGAEHRAELLTFQPVGDRLQTDPRPFALDATPVDALLTTSDGVVQAWVLQQGARDLLSLQWPSLATAAVALPSAATALGTLSDGTLYALHPESVGGVSFVEPDGTLTSIDDFALTGLLTRAELATEAP